MALRAIAAPVTAQITAPVARALSETPASRAAWTAVEGVAGARRARDDGVADGGHDVRLEGLGAVH